MLMVDPCLNQVKGILKGLSNMTLDDELRKLWMSKKELYIMSITLATFAQEMHWVLDATENKNIFRKKFWKNFGFYLSELDYINDALGDLYTNLKNIAVESSAMLYVSNETHVPRKPVIIHTALNECGKNYEDYEISIITGISKKELDTVLKEFKEKVIDKMEIGSVGPTAQAD
ncbi:hypothetical protein GAMM_60306 [Gammaproteobacteria bacterium]